MKTLDTWLAEYGDSHQNRTNQYIHKVCVPVIVVSLLGMLWNIQLPFSDSVWSNAAVVFMFTAMIFYATLGIAPTVLMFIYGSLSLGVCYSAGQAGWPLLAISVTVFVVAWIGQFIGHKIEGKKPSFFKDLQFLLIGPLWVFKGLLLK